MTYSDFVSIFCALNSISRSELVGGGVLAADDDGAWVDFQRSPVRWIAHAKDYQIEALQALIGVSGDTGAVSREEHYARVDELLRHNNELLQRYRDLKTETSVQRRGIYVASKTKHAHIWRGLRATGVPIISTWIDEAGPGESKDLADLWTRCITESASAAALVVYREPEDVLKGAWAEVGSALANGVPVFAFGIDDFTISKHPGVTTCDTILDAIDMAKAINPVELAA